MPIAFNRYVDIVSAVAGAPSVVQRDLILRIFTINPLVPTETVVEFTSAVDVKSYFGSSSEEYARALFYFAWISKNRRRPGKLGFQRWADGATAPLIYGKVDTYAVGSFTGIVAGTFNLTLGAVTNTVTVNFGASGSLAAIAAVVQAAIRLAGAASGAQWTAATVTYDAVRGSFQFVGGATGAAAISAVDGTSTPLAVLGWLPAGTGPTAAIYSDGVAVESITDVLDLSVEASNNFGSFLFTRTAALTLSEVTEAAEWNELQNVSFQFSAGVTAANRAAWSAALLEIPGCELTLVDPTSYSGDYDDQCPCMILAATDYESRDASQNYMFQIFPGLSPKVNSTSDAITYDNLRINYYGSTQTAGNVVSFYQRGVMMGGATAPVDMGIYANEQWFKDAAAAALMNLLLAVTRVPTNNQGRAQILGALSPVITVAGVNGTISVGKVLTSLQIAIIGEITDDAKAWRQVQNIGYWLEVVFESYPTDDDRTEWKAVYVLVYSKDDSIRKIEGSHVLI